MVRINSSVLQTYFDVESDKSKSVCKDCGQVFKGCVIINLKRHMVIKHGVPSETFEIESASGSGNGRIKKTINIKMNSATLTRCCVEMVTRNALPFKIMDSSGFRNIIDPISVALGITINALNVKEMVKVSANKIKLLISNELKGQIFSLKMDSASK